MLLQVAWSTKARLLLLDAFLDPNGYQCTPSNRGFGSLEANA